jgi:hypothetical protein
LASVHLAGPITSLLCCLPALLSLPSSIEALAHIRTSAFAAGTPAILADRHAPL